jgi:hypothetical protein
LLDGIVQEVANMMTTIPSFGLDLGSEASRLGWTMDGVAIALLVILLIPWLVLSLAAIADVVGMAPRRTTVAFAGTVTAETTGEDVAVVVGAASRRAA